MVTKVDICNTGFTMTVDTMKDGLEHYHITASLGHFVMVLPQTYISEDEVSRAVHELVHSLSRGRGTYILMVHQSDADEHLRGKMTLWDLVDAGICFSVREDSTVGVIGFSEPISYPNIREALVALSSVGYVLWVDDRK